MRQVRLSLEEAKARLEVSALWPMLKLPGEPTRSCRCPFHEDQSPSFSVFPGNNGALRWKCFAGCGEGGPVELVARARGIGESEACRVLIEMASGRAATLRQPNPTDRACLTGFDSRREPQPAQLRLPADLHRGSRDDLRAVADLRGLSLEGVELANERGLLWFAPWRGFPAWIVTDNERCNAQARRLDGGLWEHIGGKKASNLPGSRARWPIGAREALPFQSIVLVEGGPDLLAAHHFAHCEERESTIAVVAMLGAGLSIADDALPLFAGKLIRIFPHIDEPGMKATERWARQLERAGAEVDFFDFSGLRTIEGKTIKDLNDCAHGCADDFEELRGLLP
jgi:hypothetical protein